LDGEAQSNKPSLSKLPLAELTGNLAIEIAPYNYNIVVNSISPGFIRTAMSIVNGVDETTAEDFTASYVNSGRIPLRRAGRAEEMAAAVLYLASRECTYMAGVNLLVDGGLTITLWGAHVWTDQAYQYVGETGQDPGDSVLGARCAPQAARWKIG